MSQLDEEILVCVRAIRPALPALLGAEAAGVDAEIARMLSHHSSRAISATLLLELLRHHEPTRRWAQRFVAHERDALSGRLEHSTYQPWLGVSLRVPRERRVAFARSVAIASFAPTQTPFSPSVCAYDGQTTLQIVAHRADG